VAYLWGVYWLWQGERDRAMTAFQYAVARQPRHEPAHTALAEQFDAQDRLDRAIDQYLELVTRFPASETGLVGLARVLRKLGRLDDARTTLEPLSSQPEAPIGALVEMARIASESGNYEEAERWFGQADLDPADFDTLSAAATTIALAGETTRAERLFRRNAAAFSASTRQYDLGQRLAVDPNDRQAAGELQSLLATSTAVSGNPGGALADPLGRDGPEGPGASGPELFALYCSACHGEDGDSNGRAARHLFPRPQDLRAGRFRLVSTLNAAPTPEDLEVVMRQGMPGTSMPSYEDLSEDQRRLLADEVLRLHREGVGDAFVRALEREGEETDEEEIREVVELCTTPGEVVKPPRIGPPDPPSVARGEAMYTSLGCHNCHGEDGVGASDTFLFDDKGRPARPRDLVHEPLKGGEDPQSIFLRIVVGMPGSPHPAAGNIEAAALIDLVQYCRSLGRDSKRALTNHQQAILGTSRAYVAEFGGARGVQ
jgi:mono/diheme cytochrome c family protein